MPPEHLQNHSVRIPPNSMPKRMFWPEELLSNGHNKSIDVHGPRAVLRGKIIRNETSLLEQSRKICRLGWGSSESTHSQALLVMGYNVIGAFCEAKMEPKTSNLSSDRGRQPLAIRRLMIHHTLLRFLRVIHTVGTVGSDERSAAVASVRQLGDPPSSFSREC